MGAIQGAVNSIIGTVAQATSDTKAINAQQDANKLNAINAANNFNDTALDAIEKHDKTFDNLVNASQKQNDAQKLVDNKRGMKDEKTGKFVRYDAKKAQAALTNAQREYAVAEAQAEKSYQNIKGLVAKRDMMMKAGNLDSSYLTKDAANMSELRNVNDYRLKFIESLGGKK